MRSIVCNLHPQQVSSTIVEYDYERKQVTAEKRFLFTESFVHLTWKQQRNKRFDLVFKKLSLQITKWHCLRFVEHFKTIKE
jgi:hypothetical protein